MCGIEIDLILPWVSINVVFVQVVEIDLVSVSGPKMTYFQYGHWLTRFLCRWSKITQFCARSDNDLDLVGASKTNLIFAWVVEIHLISVWLIKIDLVSVKD